MSKSVVIVLVMLGAVIQHFGADEGNKGLRRPPLPSPSALRRHHPPHPPNPNNLNPFGRQNPAPASQFGTESESNPSPSNFQQDDPYGGPTAATITPIVAQPQQQSFAVPAPQAPPMAPSGYSPAPETPQPMTATDDYQPRAVKLHQKLPLHTASSPPTAVTERAKRRCPRQASILLQSLTHAPHNGTTHRVVHRKAGTVGTPFSGGPHERVRDTRGGYTASRARGPEYARVQQQPQGAPQNAPQITPQNTPQNMPQPQGTPQSLPQITPQNAPQNEDRQWAFIAGGGVQKKKKKPAGGWRSRLKPPAVTPAPGGTEIGGIGHFFTTLPPGKKGVHYPSVNSKYIPTVQNAHRYYYPPRMPLPLPTCFHNPTGYPCCNPALNDLMVETYTELESKPKFHTCNINAIAQHLQIRAEERFNTSFETVAAFDDFAQKIHFYGDLVCKVELGGKYMLAYGTVKDVEKILPPEQYESVTQSALIGGGGSADSTGGQSGGGSGSGTFGLSGSGTSAFSGSGTSGLSGSGSSSFSGSGSPSGTDYQGTTRGGRQRRETPFIGPRLPLPLNHLSRRHTMWI